MLVRQMIGENWDCRQQWGGSQWKDIYDLVVGGWLHKISNISDTIVGVSDTQIDSIQYLNFAKK